MKRRYPIGAEWTSKGVDFRVWAPDHQSVTVVLENLPKQSRAYELKKEKDGYFSLFLPKIKKETLYSYRLSEIEQLFPDPASRYQPLGVEGPSCIIDPTFKWTDEGWNGVDLEGQIIYEMHIGTFTQEGTFKAAMGELQALADLGITLIELMPINEFPGHFGWGYDGINLFAPFHLYGTPNEVKSFINQAHRLGLGVILDVVYNHFGPEGNYITRFAKHYMNHEETTEWGDAINFDEWPVREFFLTNARYWIEEYHFDGLRVDATPWFFCKTPTHILADLTKAVRKANPKKRKIIIGENETQNVKLLKPYKEGGYQFDALWNDDFHHTACVRLKGKREAYYTDYLGSPQEFISSLKYGFLYQGQYYDWQEKPRGTFDLNTLPSSLVIFLENHDQIANTGKGRRLHETCDPASYKALICLLLLGPNTPMIFQGQEFASSSPFYYFADHKEELNQQIQKGRKVFLAQFPSLATKEAQRSMLKPFDPLTFTKCKLDFNERKKNGEVYALYKDLLHLRKNDPVFKAMKYLKVDGAVLGSDSFLIRFFGGKRGDRLIIINFGADHTFNPAPEPLLVAGQDLEWEVILSSEFFIYGGEGSSPINTPHWKIPGHSAIVLKPVKKKKLKESSHERPGM